ncbi:MAG: DUF423 domain-containing protein [Fimbriimonadaceae bacterium]|nr:DUF423 domain-containing protein [Chitinophagales bacterium]
MQKNILRIAAIFGVIAVILGAFGAHSLETLANNGKLEIERLKTWETAVQYQFYHTFALCVLALSFSGLHQKYAVYAKNFFMAGIFIFCGSLYLLTLSPLFAGKELAWFGAITPIGGLFFIAGWIMFILALSKK